MPKITREIEDSLPDCVQEAIDGVEQELKSYLEQNPDTDELPDLSNDLDYSGAIHEIVDGAVPIYTSEINDIMYLHGDEVEQAFDDAGIGEKKDEGWPMGWKAAAIYCYIEQQVHEWYSNNAQDIFDTWLESKGTAKPEDGEDEEAEAEPAPEAKAPEVPPPAGEPPKEGAPQESLRQEVNSAVKRLMED